MSIDCNCDTSEARKWWRELSLEFIGTSLYVGVVATAATAGCTS